MAPSDVAVESFLSLDKRDQEITLERLISTMSRRDLGWLLNSLSSASWIKLYDTCADVEQGVYADDH